MADQTVPMVSPDGKDVSDVPLDQVQHFKSLGAKVVEAPPPPSALQQLGRGALNTLPAAGAMVGGVLSTPETMGAGTIPGIALGAGVGRGLRDLIGHFTGMDEPSSPLQKAANIVGDTAMTGATAAILPGAVAAAKAPLQTLREGAEQFGSAMPPVVRRLANLFPSLPEAAGSTLERPAWQTWGEPPAPAPGALSASDRALLARQGYSPQLIEQVAAQRAKSAGAAVAPGSSAPSWPVTPEAPPGSRIVPETGETENAWRARVASKINGGGRASAGGDVPANATGTSFQPAPMPQRPPISVSPSSQDSLAARTGAPSAPRQSLPVFSSPGQVKGVTSNALEAASNAAFAAGHYEEAERLIGQSLNAFFRGSGGPMAGILAAAIAHKARQVIEPLRADPSFQQAPPARQQQLIQQALRQPGARGSLTSLLGS